MDFPKTLYVKIEHNRESEDDFLIADANYVNLSEGETAIEVAVYDLVTVKKAVNKTELIN